MGPLVIQEIPISQIEVDASQPRKSFGNIEELADSIKKRGILQPILLEKIGENKYRIISGQRRFRACVSIKRSKITAIIYPIINDVDRISIQLIENIQRKQLSPLEEARAIHTLKEQEKLGPVKLAKALGMSKTAVYNRLSVLALPDDILSEVEEVEHVTHSLLVEIVKLRNADEQRRLWEEFKSRAGGMGVRDARKRGSYGKKYKEFAGLTKGLKIMVRWKLGKGGDFSTERSALKAALELIENRLNKLST